MTHYSPAYPFLLAVIGFLQQGDILWAGRLLGSLLFGANVALVGVAVQMSTECSMPTTGFATLFVLCSAPVIAVHSMAWSEAPFIMFSLLTFILLSLHIAQPSKYLLLLAALMAGFAVATRYMGITLLPPMVFALLFLSNRSMRYRTGEAILATALASSPLACWLVRNLVIAQTAADRTFAIHLFGPSHVKGLISTVHDFILPIAASSRQKALHLVAVGTLFLLILVLLHKKDYIRRNLHSTRMALPALCLVFFLTYVAFLAISISFFDAATPLDSRILVPTLLPLTVASVSLAWSMTEVSEQRFIKLSLLLFALLSVSTNIRSAALEALDIHNNGRGYTSRSWQSSEIVSFLADVRDSRKLYSNGPDAIRFLAEKEAATIPEKFSAFTLGENRNYAEQLSQMSEDCREGEALIVYLNGVSRRHLPSIEELEAQGDLPLLLRFEDGSVYGIAPQQNKELYWVTTPQRSIQPERLVVDRHFLTLHIALD